MKVNFRIMFIVSLLLLLALLVSSLEMLAASQSTRQQRTTPGLSNFDIRTDESKDARLKLAAHRQKLTQQQRGRQSEVKQYIREAKTALENSDASGNVVLSRLTGGPEIVSAGLQSGHFLTNASSQDRERVVRGFLRNNSALYGLRADQAAQLSVSGDYLNPAGNLAWITLNQKFNDIPVFAGQLRAGLTPAGELVRTVSTLATGIDEAQLQLTPAISAEQAVAIAAASLGVSLEPGSFSRKSASSDNRKVTFAGGPFAQEIEVELVYFPLEAGLANLSWSMVLWQDVPAYYTVVDAEKGDLFFRKNITNEQTQSVTYSIYNDDSPAPLSPSNIFPGAGTQAPGITRSLLTLTSELPAFDNLGWIPDNSNVTTGNNVDAGLDLGTPNGIDTNGRATGAPNRVFDFSYSPPPLGVDPPGGANYRMGVVTDLFFWSNRYHDQLYQYGFTEAAGNFQGSNFGRGGVGNDFVRAEAQDSSGTDNANFSTPPDGQLPRMQMYLFVGPTPQRDGSIDHDVVLHELTHGLSNRLHGNASGLTSTQSAGMGEGWSDYYARALLATADEDVNGIYAAAPYATLAIETGFVDNYYYGIRRFPYAVKTNVGLNGKPHNPLTFADIDPTKINLTDGAFPAAFTGRAEEEHNIGEVWCMALLEVRARIITRLGFAAGNARALQIVTDGMKLDPPNPTLLDARNAIILADRAGFGGADEADIWAGFAARGMGFSAKFNGGVNVTESFDTPNLSLGNVTFSDAGCNNNGFADAGETLILTVPIGNPAFSTSATSVTVSVAGGGTGNYGTINAGASATQALSYAVPADAVCGSLLTVTVNINSSFGTVARTFQIFVGQPVTTFTENFDSVTAPALPAGWTTATANSGTAWVTSSTTPDTAPNGAFTPNKNSFGSSALVSPSIPITISGARLMFRHRYNFEQGFDGGALEIKIGSGTFTDILTAGGTFLTNPYSEILPPNFVNPDCFQGLPRHNAWTGNSGGYVTAVVQLPAAAAGQNIQLRWIAGFDCSVAATDGWRVDTVSIIGNATCAAPNCATGLQFYPLAAPVRLLDTRSGGGISGCTIGVGALAANSTRTQAARTGCSTIPPNATAVIGNITVVPAAPGFLTLFPSDATQPSVANSNFKAGEITNNFFTVGLGITGADPGAFKIFTSATTDVIIDLTGYYAPPGTGGLYYHPLPSPVRLVETRPGQTGCHQPPQLVGTNNPGADPNLDLQVQGRGPGLPSACNAIPNDAVVLVGNATTVLPTAPLGFGYLTIYPGDASRPTVASSNYAGGDVINGPFAVKLGADGKFKIYTFSTTDLVVDISGYYSASASDANGTGLLFNPLPKPMRLLETRNIPGFPLTGCYQPQAPISGGTPGIRTQQVWGTCSDQPITIPDTSRAIVGNVTVINPLGGGFGTFFPGDVGTAPTVATTNYPLPVVFGYNRHYYVGLSPSAGTFKILTQFASDYIVDVSGYFAP